jgi:hypothetical protein
MITAANDFLADELASLSLAPLSEKEIRSYYREDAFIWSLYAAMRRVDRGLHKIRCKKYQYILPGKVKR